MKVLLVSNSTLYQRGYLDHVARFIQDLFRRATKIAFIPYALFDREAYARKAEQRFAALGLNLLSVHRAEDPRAVVTAANGIFVGGGNTFRLLDALYRHRLIDVVRERVEAGVPYLGSSAGSIVAGPTIMTTKDMPATSPPADPEPDPTPAQRIEAALAELGAAASIGDLRRACCMRTQSLCDTLADLVRTGRVVKSEAGYRLR